MTRYAQSALMAGLITFFGCSEPTSPPPGNVGASVNEASATGFSTDIRWTSYGIPHVSADDWRSLGYGFAYATAKDAVCVIARDVVMVNGELSRFFGADGGNLESDVFHQATLNAGKLSGFSAQQSPRSADFLTGYVAGYNRYLRDNNGRLAASCNGEPWVRAIDENDVARLTIGVGIRYGLGRFQKEMALAAPPVGEQTAALGFDTDFDPPRGFGSNAVAFGSEVTESGRGLLFGNPHYPWRGSSRFHLIHTTIPGELDVMGVSLYTTSRVAIGFNKDIAWSHTVSTGLRATLYELELDPENPLRYRYGNDYRQIEEVSVPVSVVDEQGNTVSAEHQIYLTHYGPIIESDSLVWDAHTAYAIRDVNLDNSQASDTYDALNKATSIDEVERAISQQGVAWTNTIAADRDGTAFYGDISVTPNVDSALLERCRVTPEGVPGRAVVLDGSDPACEWRQDSGSAVPGALPPDQMPRLKRTDYVANSNDSYWLSNPEAPLEGYSPIIGNERSARSLRTRAGLVFIREALAAGKIGPDDVQAMLYSHRNFGAELLLDDVLEVCTADLLPVDIDGRPVDVTRSCEVLSRWDRRNLNASRGGHVWREFWRLAQSIDGLYAIPFDAADPVNTPRGVAVDVPEVRAELLNAMARAQVVLEEANIALDARLGEIQFAERNGERIPIPGGEGWAGMWSMIVTGLEPDLGYSPIRHGNSFIQVVSWDQNGVLDPRGILTYSQSQEPESPHYDDLTRLYSDGEWIRFPFSDAEIDADPNLVTLSLVE